MIHFKMLHGILILSLGVLETHSQVCGKPKVNSRIVGGTDAEPGAWPWQISLQKNGAHICGGSLITNNWVVTAAHCVANSNKDSTFTVYLGINQLSAPGKNAISMAVKEIIVNQKYTQAQNGNDVALLRLIQSVTYTDYILPVCLPDSTVQFQDGLRCWSTGWGTIESGVSLPYPKTLQEVELPIITRDQCDCLYHIGTNYTMNDRLFSNDVICAGYTPGSKDTCQGDSGGPLVCKMEDVWVLAGTVSFGDGCALPLRPGVYARITAFQSWLQDKIPELNFAVFNQTGTLGTQTSVCGYQADGTAVHLADNGIPGINSTSSKNCVSASLHRIVHLLILWLLQI